MVSRCCSAGKPVSATSKFSRASGVRTNTPQTENWCSPAFKPPGRQRSTAGSRRAGSAAAAQIPSTARAAEKPAAEKPGAAAKPATEEKKAAADESKTDTAQSKGSIADQAEAALKAAAEADPAGASSEPPNSDGSEAKDDTEAPPPVASAAKGPSPQRFVPTEQVRADFDVSFPIDI